jgi:hypothetical protein
MQPIGAQQTMDAPNGQLSLWASTSVGVTRKDCFAHGLIAMQKESLMLL